MTDHLESNRTAWDHRVKVHLDSQFYDVPGFLAGASSLNPIELELLGPLQGQRLLHLQCHFGLDSLSCARLGAEVTGVDLSPEGVHQARQLAQQAKLEAEFVCADVFDYLAQVEPTFDRVLVSYGALCWLPSLAPWAEGIARALKPGGRLVLVEFHPLIDLMAGYGYFHRPEPDWEEEGTYTENCPGETHPMACWVHNIGEVAQALRSAGLTLESLGEHAVSPYPCFDGMTAVEGGYVQLHQGHPKPLLYHLVATKPES
ncbi:class I SAM-dependent methyltransferase [Ferrimonas marina]|uniref:Methyltransferase domain-containing protein n=1 Tax=Ferrimonas marina TaxID=299255 RepID=A0A1M5RHJ2_9GAMM|nr:class I SAM-dependent methyltransferase [Ferrimonas marina]SHH25253.1 Methyltransferase domain-containing protein [Ferrimonas marina]